MSIKLDKDEVSALCTVLVHQINTYRAIDAIGSCEHEVAAGLLGFLLNVEEIEISDNLPF